MTLATSYDEVPYPGQAYAESHPAHVATLATLLGMAPAPPERCRVLELGCAAGANLLPMAALLPGSTFVGLDLAASQVDAGRRLIAELGLANVTLHHMDLAEFDSAGGEFDYIIAHGVYSWVPAETRDRLMAVCARHLAPHGVAYISYNTYPGWHWLGALRDMMLYRVGAIPEPHERAARALDMLETLAAIGQTETAGSMLAAAAAFYKEHLDDHGAMREALLLHDALEQNNAPVYFYQFAKHAGRHGLQYLAESDFAMVMPRGLPEDAVRAISGFARDGIDFEQYMDFLRGRMFRRTLLCRAERRLKRTLTPARLDGMFLSSRARPLAPTTAPGAAMQFEADDGARLTLDQPMAQAALLTLIEHWPRALGLADLLAQARARIDAPASPEEDEATTASLLRAFCYSARLVNLHLWPPPAQRLGPRPRAWGFARHQARTSTDVINMLHENVRLDPLARRVIELLDGSRDQEALLAALREQGYDEPPEHIQEQVGWLASTALIEG
jgi:SAM-dependent methyltransferase